MMTAASGGNRESLLGQWPARRKCFLSTKRMLGAATRVVARRRRDGEGKPVSKEHLHSDKHWLLIESSYRCVFVLSQHPCPLSLTSFASSPKGGATGVSVRLPLDEQSTMSRKR